MNIRHWGEYVLTTMDTKAFHNEHQVTILIKVCTPRGHTIRAENLFYYPCD